MPRNSHSVQFRYDHRGRFIAEDVSEATARSTAKRESQRLKNRAINVLDAHGNVKATFLNGKDVS